MTTISPRQARPYFKLISVARVMIAKAIAGTPRATAERLLLSIIV
jgi:hypothetical protein